MGIVNKLHRWMLKTGLRGMIRKGQATSNNGTATLSTGWEKVFGASGLLKDYGEVWGEASSKDSLEAYEINAIVFACARVIMQAFNEANLTYGYEDDNGFNEVDDDVDYISKRPNAYMSQSKLFEHWLAHKILTGESYIWKWRDGARRITELWPLPTHWIIPVPAKQLQGNVRFLQRYDLLIPGMSKATPIPLEDMIADNYISPINFINGTGPLEAGYRSYTLDQNREDYLKEMLSMPIPGMKIRTLEELPASDKADIRAAIQEACGVGKRGKPIFLHGEQSELSIETPLEDLDWPGLSASVESRICMVLGVPPLLVHARVAQENSPLSSPNVEAAQKLFYRGTMSWHWKAVGEALTQGLVLNEGNALNEFRFDTTSVKALQDDLTKVAEMMAKVAPLGVMLKNEVRERLGFEPLPEFENQVITSMQMIAEELGVQSTPEDGQPEKSLQEHLHEWDV